MKLSIQTILIIGCLLIGFTAHAETTKPLESKISDVTVFLEGAQITRKAQTLVQAGETTLTFTNLASDIDAKSIQVKAIGPVTVISVNHQNNFIEKTQRNDEVSKLINQIKEINNKINLENIQLSVLNEELNFLNTNRQMAGKDQALPLNALKEAAIYYQSRLLVIKTSENDHNKVIEKLNQQMNDINNQIAGIQSSIDKPKGEITVKIDAAKSTSVSFEISYAVKQAGWFPTYDIRAEAIDQPIELVYKANVFQNTGEDWTNVALSMSSGNPNLSGVAPQLQTWFLDYNSLPPTYKQRSGLVQGIVYDTEGQPLPGASIVIPGTTIGTITDVGGNYTLTLPANANQLQAMFIGFETQTQYINSNIVNFRLQENKMALDEVVTIGYGSSNDYDSSEALTGRIAGITMKSSKMKSPSSIQLEVATQQTPTNVLFKVAKPYTIASNAKHTTVTLDNINIEAAFEYFAAPKIDPNAYLLAYITNWEQYNLLSGEANIFFEGTFTGKTVLDLSTLTDTLTLSLGRDKNMVVAREKAKDQRHKQFLGNKVEEGRSWIIQLRNQKQQTATIKLLDQIPVSQREEIEVKTLDLSGGNLSKEDGIVEWKLTLAPATNKTIKLQYQVKYPKNNRLVIE